MYYRQLIDEKQKRAVVRKGMRYFGHSQEEVERWFVREDNEYDISSWLDEIRESTGLRGVSMIKLIRAFGWHLRRFVLFGWGDWYRQAKWFIQRGRRGWSGGDAWDLGGYLCWIISPAVRSIKNNGSSYPVRLDAGGDEYVEWSEMLERIALGFEAAETLMSLEYLTDDDVANVLAREKLEQLYDEGMDLFKLHLFGLWY